MLEQRLDCFHTHTRSQGRHRNQNTSLFMGCRTKLTEQIFVQACRKLVTSLLLPFSKLAGIYVYYDNVSRSNFGASFVKGPGNVFGVWSNLATILEKGTQTKIGLLARKNKFCPPSARPVSQSVSRQWIDIRQSVSQIRNDVGFGGALKCFNEQINKAKGCVNNSGNPCILYFE